MEICVYRPNGGLAALSVNWFLFESLWMIFNYLILQIEPEKLVTGEHFF